MSIGIAFRAFFKSLFDSRAAEQIAVALDSLGQPRLADSSQPTDDHETKATPSPVASQAPAQDPAVTLMAALQRDARLIDLIYEDLDQYQDAQVGAAARPCLKQCRTALDRLLNIRRVVDQAENELVEMDANVSAGRIRFVGDEGSAGQPAKLVHPGWLAGEVKLPKWTGESNDANVIAPAQVSRT